MRIIIMLCEDGVEENGRLGRFWERVVFSEIEFDGMGWEWEWEREQGISVKYHSGYSTIAWEREAVMKKFGKWGKQTHFSACKMIPR